jgi:signal transduction histidine kinase/ActR/RegA family two-component response regulator
MTASADPQTDRRVVVLTPTGRDAQLVAKVIADMGTAIAVSPDFDTLITDLQQGAGTALIAEEALTPVAIQRLSALLAGQPSWSDLPLVILTGTGEPSPGSLSILRRLEPVANITLLERPVRVVTLQSAIRTALRARRRQYEVRDHLAERQRAEAERERLLAAEQMARAEVEGANRAKDEFLAILSHELRTPLQSMLGWVKLLKLGKLDAEASARALATLERNTRAQAQLIGDLLDVSRIVAGKLRVELRPIELRPVLEAALESIRAAAEEKGLQLQATFDSRVIAVAGDAERLEQVAWNLLSNAVKFTPGGGRITVRLERTATQARIVVRDTGRGIAPATLPHIFERFRQADSTTTRVYGGLGLGLAIVRHLVEAHHGIVRAESAGEGRGATFRVTLPLLQRTADTDEGGARGWSGERLAPSLVGLNLLVVDDDADTRELLATALRGEGADVRTAASVAEALAALERRRPDVIISDISMPGEDGYTLARRLRALDHGGGIPALALTAHARPEDSEQAFLAGFEAHLAKPVSPDELAQTIARLAARPRSYRSGPPSAG